MIKNTKHVVLADLPKVVLVGRTNVGKSTLFNRLTEKNLAIISPIAGTTRDYQETNIEWAGKIFNIIDTGGLQARQINEIDEKVEQQTQQTIKQSALLVLVVDGHTGLMPDDLKIFQTLKKTNKKIILAINKSDNPKKWPNNILEFSALGIADVVPVSANTGAGSGDLLDLIVKNIPNNKINKKNASLHSSPMQEPIKIAIIGQPNVGKSSLINSILGTQKQIVSSLPHTTRDVQEIKINYQGKEIILIDTAGIRRQLKKGKKLEKFSVNQAIKKLKSAHIALLVIDISKPLTFQDKHLSALINESYLSPIIIANKWDLITDKDSKSINRYEKYIYSIFPYFTWAPIIFTSATKETRTNEILKLASEIYANRFRKLTDRELDRWLKKILKKHAPSRGKGVAHPHIYYIKQTDVNPPTFEVKIKYQKSLHASYLRFLEKNMRHDFKFTGTALKLYITSVK